jgi:alpha-1,3-rhamnosyl/mannosyltransferase
VSAAAGDDAYAGDAMRVLIDVTFAHRAPYSGTAIYLEEICCALRAIEGVDPVEVANEGRRAPAGGGPGSVRNLAADLRWTHVTLPRLARRHRVDVIHHVLPVRSYVPGLPPQVVTVHDLAFARLPEMFDARFRTYANVVHRAAAAAAGAVIAVSETTARDLRELWGIDSGRIVVAPHGPGQRLESVPRPARPTHFLFVGDAEPRKDLDTLLSAYARYRAAAERPLALVLAGSAESGAGADGVLHEHAVTRHRLAELHAGAAALVHPSLYEGFGLTPLEAMAAGTPVLAARAPGVVEVCGQAARYFAPGDAAALATALAELSAESSLRLELSRRGRERAAGFSWDGCARAHAAAYSLATPR